MKNFIWKSFSKLALQVWVESLCSFLPLQLLVLSFRSVCVDVVFLVVTLVFPNFENNFYHCNIKCYEKSSLFCQNFSLFLLFIFPFVFICITIFFCFLYHNFDLINWCWNYSRLVYSRYTKLIFSRTKGESKWNGDMLCYRRVKWVYSVNPRRRR